MDLAHQLVKSIIHKWKNGNKEYLMNLAKQLSKIGSIFGYMLSFINISYL